MQNITITVPVPMTVCTNPSCTTTPVVYGVGLAEAQDDGSWIARNLILPPGWSPVEVGQMVGTICDACRAILFPS